MTDAAYLGRAYAAGRSTARGMLGIMAQDAAEAKLRAYGMGRAYARGRCLAQDAAKWITVHPNGKGVNAQGGDIKGRPALIDSETGKILGGMGGRFNGRHISAVKKGNRGARNGERIPSKTVRERPGAAQTAQTAEADMVRQRRNEFKKQRDETAAFIKGNPEAKKLSDELHENVEKAGDACKKLLEKSGETGPFMELAGRSAFIDRAIHKLGVEKVRAEFDRKAQAKSKAAETRARKLQELKDRVRQLPLPSNHVRLKDPAKVLKQTEKAVQVDFNGIKTWLPKSQITMGEGYVSGVSDFIRQKDNLSMYTEGRSEQHEQNYQSYMKRKEQERREERKKALEEANRIYKEEAEERERQRQKAVTEEWEGVKKKHPEAVRILVPVSSLRFGVLSSSPLAPPDLKIVAESKYGGTRYIDEDMPSIKGAQLLSHEGEKAVYAYVVKR